MPSEKHEAALKRAWLILKEFRLDDAMRTWGEHERDEAELVCIRLICSRCEASEQLIESKNGYRFWHKYDEEGELLPCGAWPIHASRRRAKER